MRIRTGKLQKDEEISIFKIKIWDATYWELNNKSLFQSLKEKAYNAAGISPGDPMYGATYNLNGTNWCFEVTIHKKKWVEVES